MNAIKTRRARRTRRTRRTKPIKPIIHKKIIPPTQTTQTKKYANTFLTPFQLWFKKAQENSDNPGKDLQGILPTNIQIWADKTNTDLSTLSLKEATQKTIDYEKEQIAVKIKERKEYIEQLRIKRQNNPPPKHSPEQEIIIEKYLNKECLLNGYPAIIEEYEPTHVPLIRSKHSYIGDPKGNYVKLCSWNSLEKHFPNFAGGTLYTEEDTEDTLNERIKEEKQREPYKCQDYVLYRLKSKLEKIIEKSIQFMPEKGKQWRGDHYFHKPTTIIPKNISEIPMDIYFQEREKGRIIIEHLDNYGEYNE